MKSSDSAAELDDDDGKGGVSSAWRLRLMARLRSSSLSDNLVVDLGSSTGALVGRENPLD